MRFLNNLINEVSELFKDQSLFLGGDEFETRCWFAKRNPDNYQHVVNSQIATGQFFHIINQFVENLKVKRTSMFWQEVLEMGGNVGYNSIVNVWKNVVLRKEALTEAVRQKNAKIVVSNGWYLDHVKYGEQSWRERYDSNIYRVFPNDHELIKAVIGGESCLWGEFVDSTNFLQQAWPDAAAMGEKLWFDNNLNSNQYHAQERLNEFRCRLIIRGIPAKPIQSSFCDTEWTY